MILYGSPTSPFVRRVRVSCLELDLPFDAVDVFQADGQARLRAITPLWKVPVVQYPDGQVQWDSEAILGSLQQHAGPGPFRAIQDPVRESNIHHAIVGALESAINVFYLRRDGVDTDSIPYMQKQNERVDAALAWVASQLHGDTFLDADAALTAGGFGPLELTLFCTLDWLRFREVRPVEQVPAFAEFLAAHQERPSLVATHPSRPFVSHAG